MGRRWAYRVGVVALVMLPLSGCLAPEAATTEPSGVSSPPDESNDLPDEDPRFLVDGLVELVNEGNTSSAWNEVRFEASGPADSWFAFWVPFPEVRQSVRTTTSFSIHAEGLSSGPSAVAFMPDVSVFAGEERTAIPTSPMLAVQNGTIELEQEFHSTAGGGAGVLGFYGLIGANAPWTLSYRTLVEGEPPGIAFISNASAGRGPMIQEHWSSPQSPVQHRLAIDVPLQRCAWVVAAADAGSEPGEYIGNVSLRLPNGRSHDSASIQVGGVLGPLAPGAGRFVDALDMACEGRLALDVTHAAADPGMRVLVAVLPTERHPWPQHEFGGVYLVD